MRRWPRPSVDLAAAVAAAAALAPALLGCMSYASMRTARALDPGTVRVDVGAGAMVSPHAAEAAKGEVRVRYGVAPGLDLGLEVQGLGGELSGTVQLARGDRFDAALVPSVALVATGNFDDESVTVWVPKLALLLGHDFGETEEHQVVIGPTVLGELATASGNLAADGLRTGRFSALLAGASLGVSLALSERFRFMPEVDVLTPLAGDGIPVGSAATPQMIEAPDVALGRPWIVQLGLSASIGDDGRGRR